MVARPDLAGLRIKDPLGPRVYLIDDDGTKRLIPDPTTYDALFRDWHGIADADVADVHSIDDGPDITVGAILAKSKQLAKIYLIDNGTKRWITTPAIMDKFYFAWNKIQIVPEIALDFIPNGADIV